MIEEIREKRIKVFEIIFTVLIAILLIWLLTYEIFFKETDNPINSGNDVEVSVDDEIDEKNIYDVYTSKDRKYTLTIVKISDRKAYNDAKKVFEEINDDQYYRNQKAIYYGYLNDVIFEITNINEDIKYSLVKGQLISDNSICYNFIINKETKIIEEHPDRAQDEKRFFEASDKGLYHTIKVDGNYYFREEYNGVLSILYTSSWTKLGFIKSTYIPTNNKIIVYDNDELDTEIIYDYSGKVLSRISEDEKE